MGNHQSRLEFDSLSANRREVKRLLQKRELFDAGARKKKREVENEFRSNRKVTQHSSLSICCEFILLDEK